MAAEQVRPVGATRFCAATRARATVVAGIPGLLAAAAVVLVTVLAAGWGRAALGVLLGLAFAAVLHVALQWARTGSPSLGWDPEGLRFRIDGVTVVADWRALRSVQERRDARWGTVEGVAMGHTRAYRRDGLTLGDRALERLDRSGFDVFAPLSLFGGRQWREGVIGEAVAAYRPDLFSSPPPS